MSLAGQRQFRGVQGQLYRMTPTTQARWRDYPRFTGLARESIVAAFAFAAHHLHMIRTWKAREAEAERRMARLEPRHLPPKVPVETVPPNPVEPVRKRRAPKGLPELGDDPPDS